ncbi:MAG: hypothetical protein HOO93_16410 [Methyloglobulus sp.]|nr:hypothetical protein [Methyloglobulus sp.]
MRNSVLEALLFLHSSPVTLPCWQVWDMRRVRGRIIEGGSHAWGQMYCPYNDKEYRRAKFCRPSIWRVRAKTRKTTPSEFDELSIKRASGGSLKLIKQPLTPTKFTVF